MKTVLSRLLAPALLLVLSSATLLRAGQVTFDYESVTNGATTFSSSSQTWSLTGANFTDIISSPLGSPAVGSASPGSNGYMDTGVGTARALGNIGGIKAPAGFTFRAVSFDIYPSSDMGSTIYGGGNDMLGTVGLKFTVIGKKNNVQVVTANVTDSARTPAETGSVPGGYWHFLDLSTTAFATTDIDTVEFVLVTQAPSPTEINYLAVDNFIYSNFAPIPPPTPTITPGGPTTFCAGGSVTLTSSSAVGNQWYINGNPIGGATNQTYSATASGNYTVIVTISSVSSAPSAATVVTVNPIPATPTITPGGPTTFCAGGSVTLTSSNVTGNQWYLNGNPIGGATNQTYNATASGNYTVIDTSLGCSSAASAATTVTVNPLPATPTITPGGPTTFCAGGSVTLTSSNATGNQWFSNGNPIGGATNNTYIATASGNYTVADTVSGCTSASSAATVVTVNPIPATPTITPGGPTTFCTGGSVTLTSSNASGNQWFLNGNPIGGATNQTYIATASGSYTVTDTSLGCTSASSAATVVTVNPIPATPTIAPGGPTTFAAGGSVTLTSSIASGNQWFLNGNPIGGATNQTYIATASGNYTVTDTSLGCSSAASAATTVTVVSPPTISKSFSPPSIQLNGSTSLSFTVTNPNATVSLTGVAFTDTLPAGLVVATPNGLSGNIGGGTISATAGSNTISLSGATLAAGASGMFSVNVIATSVGTKVNTTSAVTSIEGGTGNTASASLTVNPGTATHFLVTASSPVVAGALATVTVTAQDSGGNTAPTYTGTVHFTGTDLSAVLPADATLANGVGTFSATFKTAGTQTITATDTVTAAITGTSGSVVVNPAATAILIVSAPATAFFGVAFNITVASQDAFGNATPAYTGPVHFTSSDSVAVLPADATLTSGVGTFSVTLKTLNTQTITATDIMIANITGTSGNIVVLAPVNFTSAPTAVPNPAIKGFPVSFTTATNPANAIVTWDFGDGSAIATGASVQHIYTVSGTYTAAVTAQDPISGGTATQTISVLVTDATFLPGTLEIKITQGRIRLYPSLLRLTGTVPFPAGTNFSGSSLTLIANGLNETFKLNAVGNASNADGTLRFKANRSTPGITHFSIFVHGGNVGTSLAQTVALDSNGRPTKLLAEIKLNGLVGSYVTPLNYLTPGYPGLAKFGTK